MAFSKNTMQEELLEFLQGFGRDLELLYGVGDSTLTGKETVEQSPIWRAIDEMYDYGVLGQPNKHLFPGAVFQGIYSTTESLLRGMTSLPMSVFMSNSSNKHPRLALLAAQTAVARIMLDGGDRHADHDHVEFGLMNGNLSHLTIAEVALLANMDERSVRNAANPKVADPLRTEQFGKRSLVSPEEARRWLAGRKGFISTKPYDGQFVGVYKRITNQREEVVKPDKETQKQIKKYIKDIERLQKKTGLTYQDILTQQIYEKINEIIKTESGEEK